MKRYNRYDTEQPPRYSDLCSLSDQCPPPYEAQQNQQQLLSPPAYLNAQPEEVIRQLYPSSDEPRGFVELNGNNKEDCYFFSLPNTVTKIEITAHLNRVHRTDPYNNKNYKNQLVFYTAPESLVTNQHNEVISISNHYGYYANFDKNLGLFYYDEHGVARKVGLKNASLLLAQLNATLNTEARFRSELNDEAFRRLVLENHQQLYELYNFFSSLNANILKASLKHFRERNHSSEEIDNLVTLLATVPHGYETAPLFTSLIDREFLEYLQKHYDERSTTQNKDVDHYRKKILSLSVKIAYLGNEIQTYHVLDCSLYFLGLMFGVGGVISAFLLFFPITSTGSLGFAVCMTLFSAEIVSFIGCGCAVTREGWSINQDVATCRDYYNTLSEIQGKGVTLSEDMNKVEISIGKEISRRKSQSHSCLLPFFGQRFIKKEPTKANPSCRI